MPGTRKLGRTTDSRKAMLRAMVTYLFENGKIETTVTRAKEVRSMAEKMVTLGKQEDLHAKRQVYSYITKEDVAKKVIDEIGPKYADIKAALVRLGRRCFCLLLFLLCKERAEETLILVKAFFYKNLTAHPLRSVHIYDIIAKMYISVHK